MQPVSAIAPVHLHWASFHGKLTGCCVNKCLKLSMSSNSQLFYLITVFQRWLNTVPYFYVNHFVPCSSTWPSRGPGVSPHACVLGFQPQRGCGLPTWPGEGCGPPTASLCPPHLAFLSCCWRQRLSLLVGMGHGVVLCSCWVLRCCPNITDLLVLFWLWWLAIWVEAFHSTSQADKCIPIPAGQKLLSAEAQNKTCSLTCLWTSWQNSSCT